MKRSCPLMSYALVSAMLFPNVVFAQAAASYPAKPVLIVVAYPAGGANDIETRLYAPKLAELLGQPFTVDFKAGAGGTVGAAYVAKAAPDGYTLLNFTSGNTITPAFYKDLPFDTVKDFAPISLMTQKYIALLANPSFAATTFPEYIAYAKANPGKINFGTSGGGSNTHLAGAFMHSLTNSKVTFIHYKGTALPDLVAGRLDVVPVSLVAGLPLIKSGKLRSLAVLNDKPTNLLPNVPTVASYIPEYTYSNWFGFVAPGATPAAIVNKLSEAFAKVARAPDVIATMEAAGSTMVGGTPAQFRQLITSELALWRKVVQETGIKLEE